MRCTMKNSNLLILVGFLLVVAIVYYNTTSSFEDTSDNGKEPFDTRDGKAARIRAKELGDVLLSVFVLARHGARTPLHLLPGVEEASYSPDLLQPFVMAHLSLRELNGSEFKRGVSRKDQEADAEKLKGGAGRGRLTKVGEKQLFDLGLRLREKYIKKLNFITDKYDYNEIFVRSTHYLRTIDSAKSFLTGFYGKHPIDLNDCKISKGQFNFTVDFQTLKRNFPCHKTKDAYIIYLKNYADDSIFPNPERCAYLRAFRDHQFDDKLYKNAEYIQNLKEMYAMLGIPDQKDPDAFTNFRDDFAAREVHDLQVPANLKPYIKKYDKFAAMELAVHVLGDDVRLTGGPLLNEFKEGLLNVIKSDQADSRSGYHKFNYYSNHDSTIMAVLIALGLVDDSSYHWPPFASTFTFELWRDYSVETAADYSGYYVRVLYCEKPVELPSCHDGQDRFRCSMKDFLKLMNKYSVSPSEFDALCDRKYPAN